MKRGLCVAIRLIYSRFGSFCHRYWPIDRTKRCNEAVIPQSSNAHSTEFDGNGYSVLRGLIARSYSCTSAVSGARFDAGKRENGYWEVRFTISARYCRRLYRRYYRAIPGKHLEMTDLFMNRWESHLLIIYSVSKS